MNSHERSGLTENTMNKFTPGPWVLDKAVSGWNLLANGANITTEPFDCSDADAELMASAPDLARALEAAKVALDKQAGFLERLAVRLLEKEPQLSASCVPYAQACRIARDDVAAVLVNAVGEG